MKKKRNLIIVAVIAAVLVGVMLLLLFLPKSCDPGSDSSAATGDEAEVVQLSTDSKGVHQVKITDEKKASGGDAEVTGTLIEYTPAQLKKIHVENRQGSFDVTANTPEGEATVYTLVGYEDFNLQTGAPDSIANAAARLEFSMLAGLDDGSSDFYKLVNERGYKERIEAFAEKEGLQDFTVQGEFCAPGIQQNRLKLKRPEWYVFTIMENGRRVGLDRMLEICRELEFTAVPIEEVDTDLPSKYPTVEALLERADGNYPNGGKKEGIVIRPTEPVFSSSIGAELSMKVVSNKYLLKNED